MSSNMDAAARLAFNMKVLRRHDPHIDDIIESASFVVLYSHDGEWTKTGIEGPMFLYRRSISPPYGFFILNRNGVENFSADLTPSDDLDLTPEFIIYRPSYSNDDDIYGIWVFEPVQRRIVGEQMLKLQQMPTTNNAQAISVAHAAGVNMQEAARSSSSSQGGQRISLDSLFGSVSAHQAQQSQRHGEAPEPASTSNGLALLDSMFQSARPQPPPASLLPQPQDATTVPGPPHDVDGAAGLKALIGLGPGPEARTPSTQSIPTASLPQDLNKLLDSGQISAGQNQGAPKADSNGNGERRDDTSSQSMTATLLDEALKPRQDTKVVLSRSDFVREVLSLIHTEKDFVDDIYARYRRRIGQ